MNLKQYENKIRDKFPEEDLRVDFYRGMKLETAIFCNGCGTKHPFKRGESPLKKEKITLCKKCTLSPQKKKTKGKVDKWFSTTGHKKYSSYKIENYDNIEVTCIECGKISKKSFSDLSTGKGCLCQVKNRLISDDIFQQEIQEVFDGEYISLESYKGRHSKILFSHSCGFKWRITPSNLLLGKGCPRCFKKVSKGERAIELFLIQNRIPFVKEFPIQIEGKTLFCDFFLLESRTVVEYNGIQHYEPVEFFGGEEQFKKQVFNDNLKKTYCSRNEIHFISIKYTDDIFSQCSTTIPKGSRVEA